MMVALQVSLADSTQQTWVNTVNVTHVEYDGMPATKRAKVHLVGGISLTVYAPAQQVILQLNAAIARSIA